MARAAPTPVVLQLASPGRTHAERRSVQAAAWQGLRGRALAGSDGPDPELARLLHLLGRPAEQLELRAWWGREVRVLAAGRHGAGALAQRAATPSRSRRAGPSRTGCSGSSRLPAAARGGPARCPAPRSPRRGPPGCARPSARPVCRRRRGVARHDDHGSRGPRPGRGAGADRWGVLRREGGVLGVLDGPRGRYLLTRSTGEDGVEWTTVSPADDRQLRHRIAELLATAVSAAA
ncbi:hypothetical protein BJF90_27785 [Pseudonocardia sp. CNS-004]|nr:hypothetical protein BJF90_27785 [Pseudonocardia sp. CNS-004]